MTMLFYGGFCLVLLSRAYLANRDSDRESERRFWSSSSASSSFLPFQSDVPVGRDTSGHVKGQGYWQSFRRYLAPLFFSPSVHIRFHASPSSHARLSLSLSLNASLPWIRIKFLVFAEWKKKKERKKERKKRKGKKCRSFNDTSSLCEKLHLSHVWFQKRVVFPSSLLTSSILSSLPLSPRFFNLSESHGRRRENFLSLSLSSSQLLNLANGKKNPLIES